MKHLVMYCVLVVSASLNAIPPDDVPSLEYMYLSRLFEDLGMKVARMSWGENRAEVSDQLKPLYRHIYDIKNMLSEPCQQNLKEMCGMQLVHKFYEPCGGSREEFFLKQQNFHLQNKLFRLWKANQRPEDWRTDVSHGGWGVGQYVAIAYLIEDLIAQYSNTPWNPLRVCRRIIGFCEICRNDSRYELPPMQCLGLYQLLIELAQGDRLPSNIFMNNLIAATEKNDVEERSANFFGRWIHQDVLEVPWKDVHNHDEMQERLGDFVYAVMLDLYSVIPNSLNFILALQEKEFSAQDSLMPTMEKAYRQHRELYLKCLLLNRQEQYREKLYKEAAEYVLDNQTDDLAISDATDYSRKKRRTGQ